jgi:hypothetical protein
MQTLLLLEGKKRLFKDGDVIPTPLFYLGVLVEIVPNQTWNVNPKRFLKNHYRLLRKKNESDITDEEREKYKGTWVNLWCGNKEIRYDFGDLIEYQNKVTFYYPEGCLRTLIRGDEIPDLDEKSIKAEVFGGIDPFLLQPRKKQKNEKSIFARIASNNKKSDGLKFGIVPNGLYSARDVENVFYKLHPNGLYGNIKMLTEAKTKEEEKHLISIKRINIKLPFTENNIIFVPRILMRELNPFHMIELHE